MLQVTESRQTEILELLREKRFVDVRTLTERLGVSVATIRRDLAELEGAGQLRRTHGGAVSVSQVALDPGYADRAVSNLKEKTRIAETAAAMVQDGDTVMLDAGTTALEVARKLSLRNGLTFLSNGADILAELTGNDRNPVYAVGGEYAAINRSYRGPMAEHFIRQFRVDKLILNAASVDLERGVIFTGSPANAAVQKVMIEMAGQVIVVADHSKFFKPSFSVVAPIAAMEAVVTDDGAAEVIAAAPPPLRSKFIIAPAR
ncbi:DeoR/GlpR family DNA-binding transcription regulator [Ponticoccus sp. (in: a-proteobacteria)]